MRRFVWYVYSLSFIITLVSFSYKCFYKLHLLQKFPHSLLVVLYRRRKLIYYIRQNGFTFPNYWAIHSPMFNYHSIIPWGSFRGRQEEKWGSFRGRDHFGVDLRIISGLGIISGSGSFRGLYRSHSNSNNLQLKYVSKLTFCKTIKLLSPVWNHWYPCNVIGFSGASYSHIALSFALNRIFFSANENRTVKHNNQSDLKAFLN